MTAGGPVSHATTAIVAEVSSPALARALDPDESTFRPLPTVVTKLLISLRTAPRLAAHLRVVHDVAWQLTGLLCWCTAQRSPSNLCRSGECSYRKPTGIADRSGFR